ncbi:MAG TPA: proton-conducting transporter membrane subunit, partial [Gemmataceae bacterium]|nr:proton-conducting transporter membrane subunit [Gemmataceae bacterium]
MFQSLTDTPGRLYVVATLLPLAAFVVLLVAGGLRALCRGATSGIGAKVFKLLGGDQPLKSGAYFATAVMAASAVISVYGLVLFLGDANNTSLSPEQRSARWAERTDWVRIGGIDGAQPAEWEKKAKADPDRPTPRTALALELGYKIDHLTAVIFAMVAIISTFIFLFSTGYMKDETQETVHDHDAHAHRKGRFGRFFLYLSLFCFSMFNLVIADNLFQVFVSWELVGVCSFFLIGFYYERPSASRAANKAFIVNRVGDAGFLVGILVAWTTLGTLNFDEMFQRLRSPEKDSHGRLDYAHQFVRVSKDEKPLDDGSVRYRLPPQEQFGTGTHLALFPLLWENPTHYHGMGYNKEKHNMRVLDAPPSDDYYTFGAMPYWLFVVMGVGIFLGCVGKSAQVPLHTWLPDAMEGPTPVSALIHAATMVAAGVYLVGRCFPLFAPEVLLVIAYVGAITAFFAATVAVAQTDIKRVLAYSTCSQLGFMMLALGVGGWVAGLLHLVTHAFFKALLFLCSGSVIHGCHHEQDLRKMGGLGKKMPVTAATMLIGVLAISGMPLLSGWYSKDMILSASLGYVEVHREHALLFVLPAVTAGLTAFYMFRLWFLAFTGKPRDEKLHEHAHESPRVMTLPLIFLAACSIGVAWG